MIKQFRVMPTIHQIDTCKEFVEEFRIGEGDLILTNPSYYDSYFGSLIKGATVIYVRNYGTGEPTDLMVEAIWQDIKTLSFRRVIAIGGGAIIDISKLLVQETVSPVLDLYDKKLETKKVKELVIVPTTCGTGSEVTGVSVIELTQRRTKLGLQSDEEYADYAVLIPELLNSLPFPAFATSSIDALIHGAESFLSPKAGAFTELFSKEAIRLIIKGYQRIAREGEEGRLPIMGEFLLASTYAGIAFGNAGCGAVHAMSLPFGGAYHVPHGEANYALFLGVFKTYQRLKPVGKIQIFNRLLAECLGCAEDEVYKELEKLLDIIMKRKPLSAYGVKREDLIAFTENVMTKQGRLTANNYTQMDADTVLKIYTVLY
jgi:4-hydroxybutyrate dehydrogenase